MSIKTMTKFGIDGDYDKPGDSLPKRFSEAILACVDDLERCEEHPDYEIDMSLWHSGGFSYRPCKVCLGGARLARLINDYSVEVLNCVIDGIDHRIAAMESVRSGSIEEAVDVFYGKENNKLPESRWREIRRIEEELYADGFVRYEDDSEAFKEQIRGVAKSLGKLGI